MSANRVSLFLHHYFIGVLPGVGPCRKYPYTKQEIIYRKRGAAIHERGAELEGASRRGRLAKYHSTKCYRGVAPVS